MGITSDTKSNSNHASACSSQVNGEVDEHKHLNGHSSSSNTNGIAKETQNVTSNLPLQETNCQDIKQVPIAICGMGMRLPGGIHNDTALYDFLINKGDARTEFGKDRFNIDAYYSPHSGKQGTISSKHGYFINDVDLANFDVGMFSITPAEAEQIDPNQRLVLEIVREAFESSGETAWRGKNIGIYVGMFSEDWQNLGHIDTQHSIPYRLLGTLDFALANRVSYEYDLRGPSIVIKAACSAAGLALHQALEAIRQGSISSAVVCGTNLIMAPGMSIAMTAQMALSPEGSSKSFDASADGYARGEAVNAIYIKRLDEAIRDNNPIRAIIRGSASNVDGKTNGLSMPNPESHEAAIRQAYKSAGLDFAGTAAVEAHGTGTKVGDPIEAKSIGNCFRDEGGVFLGAIKPNLGHAEGASALTSIMKAVLSLENRTIIPNIKFNTPNPAIPWEADKLVVPVEPTPWPKNKAERISVNSFGIGGSNAHFILDSAASFGIRKPDASRALSFQRQKDSRKTLLLFSANHPESLKRVSENIQAYLNAHPDRLEDLAYTLAQRREHMKLRSYCVFQDNSTPLEVSAQTKFQGSKSVSFVFTGQGAQYCTMGRELILQYPSFLENIRSMDKILHGLEHAPSWSMEDVLLNSNDSKLFGKAEYSQPLCTAIQIALVDLFALWSINPSAVIGHSSGEIAASYAAGVLTSAEAIIAAYYRGYVCKTAPKSGAMAAVGMSRQEVDKYLIAGVRVACENSGSNVTLSGDTEILEQIMSNIRAEKPDILVRKLQVEMAYHSHHMTLVGDLYCELIAKHISPRAPRIPFHSSVKSKVMHDAADFGAKYWQNNLESPVLFHAAVKSLIGSDERSVHLEIGPHAALSGPLRQIYKETKPISYVSALIRNKDSVTTFLEAIGQLHSLGVPFLYPSESTNVLTDLPAYPWHYEKSYWSETRIMKNWRFRKHLHHDLLGSRTLEGSELTPTWRNVLRVVDVPWLSDHCVGDNIVFPGAGYIAMVGEAIFQVSGIREYTVRSVELTKAMIIYNDKPLELLTNLQPQRLTLALDSDWYEFQISSYDGATWNKHCFGLIRSGRASPLPTRGTEVHHRKVASPRWYKTMAKFGQNYGPRFSRLENISASAVDKASAANVIDLQDVEESFYMFHPSTLDLVFQTSLVAIAKGINRKFETLFLPTFIEELYIGNAAGKAIQINTLFISHAGVDRCNSYGISEEIIVFYLKGLELQPMDTGIEKPFDPKVLQLEWKPHFDFLDAGDLMKVRFDAREQIKNMERLYVLCAIETRTAISGLQSAQPHFEKFRDWLEKQFELFQQPGFPLVADSMDLVRMSSTERKKLITEVYEKCLCNGTSGAATIILRHYKEAANIFEGRTNYLDLLLEGGVLANVYQWYNDMWDLSDYMHLLGHTKPQLRILEIGAGTGGLTAKFLEQLKSDFGERLYLKYTYTDISSGFFVQAKKRFKDHDGIEYNILDISKNPLEQGFIAGEYDIIVASNVLHATPSLQTTLTHVRTLLKPDGQLFMQELCPCWWEGEHDGRAESPLLSPEEWDKRLRDAGFSGCGTVAIDYEAPYSLMANIIAKPVFKTKPLPKITLLQGPASIPLVKEVENILCEYGIESETCEWGQELPENQDIISFIDLGEKPILQDVNEMDLAKLLQTVETLEDSTMLWLTPAAQIRPVNPHAAQVLGWSRCLRQELAVSIATLELENTVAGAAGAVVDVIRKIQQSRNDDNAELEPDMEYAWFNGRLNVGRFHWTQIDNALCETMQEPEMKGLAIGTPGLLQTLHWTSQSLGSPGPDEVNVKMSAVGLNFKDVLIAMGIINGDPTTDGSSRFGLEGVGYVSQAGSEVTHIAVGDRVMFLGSESVGMATTIQRAANLCVKIPEQLSDEEAATMPLVYVTVLMFLVEKWKLEKGQSILIHSAAGGVGICAINVAKWIGAEIYVTVGSEEKARFLTTEFDIPRDHIFNSRDNSFLQDIMKVTNNVGVDLVLNSLSGELLAASWQCVAPFGAMIEIGRRDMVGRGQLALSPFEDNRTFIGGEIVRWIAHKKPTVTRLLKLTVEQYLQGNFKPITPITTFNAEHIEEAFRFMQKGSHIGKIVIKFPKEDILPLASSVPLPKFRKDASYVLVGGLGGLGKGIANWMADYGAGNLIFISRSAGKTEEDQAFFKELGLMGCSSQCFPCDITDYEAVKSAISKASLPIYGAMQMSMVLSDVEALGMTLKQWDAATLPKIKGTWNLHNLLPKELDFLVLFSSISGTYGYYGQSNYASANTFLDSFAQYRHGLGQTASVLDIGPIDEIGFVSRFSPERREVLRWTMMSSLSEQNLLDALQLAVARSSTKYVPKTQSGVSSGYLTPNHLAQMAESRVPIMESQDNNLWKRDPRMSIYRNIQKTAEVQGTGAGDQLKQFLSSVMSNPDKLDEESSVNTLAKALGKCISDFLVEKNECLDLSMTLSALGVDSLVAIEARNWWKQNLGIDISVLELLSGGSITQLGELAAKRLKVKYSGK